MGPPISLSSPQGGSAERRIFGEERAGAESGSTDPPSTGTPHLYKYRTFLESVQVFFKLFLHFYNMTVLISEHVTTGINPIP